MITPANQQDNDQADKVEHKGRAGMKELEAFVAQLKELMESPAWAAVHDHLMSYYSANHRNIAGAKDERTIVWLTKVNEGISYAMSTPSALIGMYNEAIEEMKESINDHSE